MKAHLIKQSDFTDDIRERFLSKIDIHGPACEGDNYSGIGNCHIWNGGRYPDGYGFFHVNTEVRLARAHVVAFILSGGVLKEGQQVIHRCDVKFCVRPEHLRSGSHKDNMSDGVARKRFVSGDDNPSRKYPEKRKRGAHHPKSKFTDAQVVSIRDAYSKGLITQTELAENFSTTHACIGYIVRGVTWRHLLNSDFKKECFQNRRARGEKTSKSVLTDNQVTAIRNTYSLGGTTHRKLASEFKVAPTTIARILQNLSWKHLL